MHRNKPPFRADQVGSLLRPRALKEARAKAAKKEISAAELKAVEDREIARAIGKQEELGFHAVTDGEMRRASWHKDFLQHVDGIIRIDDDTPLQFKGIAATPLGLRIAGKIDFTHHPHVEHFRFVKEHAKVTPKAMIPSPSILTPMKLEDFQDPAKPAYDNLEEVRADLAAAYRKAIRAFYDAGCRYLQIDEVRMVAAVDPVYRARRRMEDSELPKVTAVFAKVLNDVLRDRPADMTITMHNCRGNFRSHWAAEGGYEPVAEQLFGVKGIDGFFLEYDSDRAGGFEPLRFVPKDKIAVLGLVTSKTPALESKDVIKRRIDEASKYVDLDRLCLSPQCGFASTEEGNELTEDQQWAKLAHVRAIADEVWG